MQPHPQEWIVREPMVVMPMRAVMNTAVRIGSPQRRTPQAALPYAGSAMHPYREMSPQDDAQRRMEELGLCHYVGGGPRQSHQEVEYRMDMYVGRDEVSCVPHGAAPAHDPQQSYETLAPHNTAATQHLPTGSQAQMAQVQTEMAALREELAQSHRQRGVIETVVGDLRQALQAVERLTAENAELKAEMRRQPSAAPATRVSSKDVTVQDLFQSMAQLPTMTKKAEPASSSFSNSESDILAIRTGTVDLGAKPAMAGSPRIRVGVKTPVKPPSTAPPSERSSVRASARKLSAASTRSAGSSAISRLKNRNTAIECDNDAVALSSTASTASVASRMKQKNTAIACINDEVALSVMDSSKDGGEAEAEAEAEEQKWEEHTADADEDDDDEEAPPAPGGGEGGGQKENGGAGGQGVTEEP